MTVIGLDASSTCTGWGVFKDGKLVDYGAIRPKGDNWRDRVHNQRPELNRIIEEYKPEKIYMEDVPLKASGGLKTLVILGGVQGVVYDIAATQGTPIEYIAPTSWRSKGGLFDGTEKGKKREVLKQKAIEVVNEKFGLELKWNGPNSIKSEDDIAEGILIAAVMLGIVSKERKFGRKRQSQS